MSTATAPGTDWRAAQPEYAGVPSDQKRVKTHLGSAARHDADGSAAGEPLATFLGLFSIGLGLWELTDPRGVADRTGTPYPGVIRAYGAREIASWPSYRPAARPGGCGPAWPGMPSTCPPWPPPMPRPAGTPTAATRSSRRPSRSSG